MKDYMKRFTKNLLILAGVFIFTWVFMLIFYPETLEAFSMIGEVYTALKLWPIIILVLILGALPKRK
jgi:hypothetical protein